MSDIGGLSMATPPESRTGMEKEAQSPPEGDAGALLTGSYTFPAVARYRFQHRAGKLLSGYARRLVMRFQLGSNAAATESPHAAEHIIDSFSIEAVGVRRTGGTIESACSKPRWCPSQHLKTRYTPIGNPKKETS